MTNIYLASKPRYEILDGLRGVAAVLVVIFHLFETYSPGVVHQIINHGYLAESWKNAVSLILVRRTIVQTYIMVKTDLFTL